MKRFKKNLIFAFLAQGTSTFLSILTSLILPKFLGVESFAYWQLFVFYSGYVGFFHFGLSDGLYLKHGGTSLAEMNKELIGSEFRYMVIWQTVISAVALIVIPFIVSDKERIFIWILTAVYLIVANATWCLGYIFQAANETKIYSTGVIISKLLFAITLIGCVLTKQYDYRFYILLYVGAQGVSLIYSVIKGRDFIVAKFLPIRLVWKEICSDMRIGINLTFSNIASSLILGFGKGFVDRHWNLSTFGIFSMAISLVNFLLQFITQISMVMFPALRQISDEKKEEIYLILRETIGIILCGILIFYVPMRFVLGVWLPQYSESLRYLSVILPICVFDGKMQMLYTTYMKVLRKERILLYINLFSCLLSLALCFFFTGIYDVVLMAVFAMIVAIAMRSIISSIYLSRNMRMKIEVNLVYEIILSILFIAINLNCKPSVAFVSYLLIYFGVIALKRKELIEVCKKVISLRKG